MSRRVSVAIPIFNEEEVIPELLRRVTAVLDGIPGGPHEMIFIDDGSSDRTVELLSVAAERDPRITVLSLSRNFGHQPAICAGIDHATGDVLVLMDGDLQDSPEAIPRFLEEYEKGFDVVYARRVQRKEGLPLRLAYWAFYRMMSVFSNVRVPLDAGDFSLMSRKVVDALKATPEKLRYVRGLRAWVGFKQTGIDVERAERQAGTPKYTLSKLLKLAFDGIFAVSVVPLRASAFFGFFTIIASLLFALYAIYARLVHQSPQGFTALIVAIVFLAGVQMFFLGVIGEYIGRVYEEAKGRPVYIVGRRIGQSAGKSEQADGVELRRKVS
jgi:dolichol-phosphate mannosyltransferase